MTQFAQVDISSEETTVFHKTSAVVPVNTSMDWHVLLLTQKSNVPKDMNSMDPNVFTTQQDQLFINVLMDIHGMESHALLEEANKAVLLEPIGMETNVITLTLNLEFYQEHN